MKYMNSAASDGGKYIQQKLGKFGIFGKGLNLYYTLTIFDAPEERAFWKHYMGKGENAGNKHFLFSTQCSLPYKRQI